MHMSIRAYIRTIIRETMSNTDADRFRSHLASYFGSLIRYFATDEGDEGDFEIEHSLFGGDYNKIREMKSIAKRLYDSKPSLSTDGNPDVINRLFEPFYSEVVNRYPEEIARYNEIMRPKEKSFASPLDSLRAKPNQLKVVGNIKL